MADYLTTDTELTSIANAIRTKGGTSAQLTYPAGFVSAIEAIPTGGSAETYIEMAQNDYSYHGLIFDSSWNLLPTRTMASEGDSILIEGQSRKWVIDSIVGVDSGNNIPFSQSGTDFTFTMPNESVSISWYYDD